MLRRLATSRGTLLGVILAAILATTGAFAASAANADPVGIGTIKDISSGDTAWMLVSSALVLMMTGPGLALFYCGLVRRKNVLATMMQSFFLMGAVSLVWVIVGYSLAFDTGTGFVGGLRFMFLREVGAAPCEYAATIPHTLWVTYQMMFAVITPALICGAYAERMKFSSMLTFSILWLLCIYCPTAHMIWGKGGWMNAFDAHAKIPVLDFAGGIVVHATSGISALVCCMMLGRRRGYGKIPMPPHSVVLSVIGAALLWVGWFGFNAGSALKAGELACSTFLATHLAGAAATLSWTAIEWFRTGKPTVLGAISGAIAGLAMITPASGFVTPMSGLLIGLIAGVACYFAATSLKQAFGYDDSLDVFGVHGISGMLGPVLAGVFAVSTINTKSGLIDGHPAQVGYQLIGVAVAIVMSVVGTFVLMRLTQLAVGLRVEPSEEFDGLDIVLHGESGYNIEEESFTVGSDDEPALATREAKSLQAVTKTAEL
ncbi:MAG: ammonium transporter [Tepidisphaerales bacterium]